MTQAQAAALNGVVAGSKYRVLAELGEGGTAQVLLAVAHGPSGFNKLVVLKSLKRHLCQEAELRNMFLSEARLAARPDCPCKGRLPCQGASIRMRQPSETP